MRPNLKTVVKQGSKQVVVDVKEAHLYQVVTFNSLFLNNGKVERVGEFCSVQNRSGSGW